MTDFRLIDLVSQREAVRQRVKGWAADDVVAWLSARGQLSKRTVSDREIFSFESTAGRHATFFFDGDEMVFVGDHTTFA